MIEMLKQRFEKLTIKNRACFKCYARLTFIFNDATFSQRRTGTG